MQATERGHGRSDAAKRVHLGVAVHELFDFDDTLLHTCMALPVAPEHWESRRHARCPGGLPRVCNACTRAALTWLR